LLDAPVVDQEFIRHEIALKRCRDWGRNMGGVIFLVVAGSIGLLFYFIPSMVAALRNHPNGNAIFVLNLFAGWTFVGWVVAIVWACTAIEDPRYRRR
jgi:hypothetical protein